MASNVFVLLRQRRLYLVSDLDNRGRAEARLVTLISLHDEFEQEKAETVVE